MADHEAYWHMQEQTRAKHAIFERYLTAWAAILGRYTSLLHYVDTHAGKGRYEGGEPGSPIIAMRLGQEVHDYLLKQDANCRLLCQYVESKQEYHASLVNELKAIERQHPAVAWKSYQGTFQEHTNEVLKQIPPNSIAFIFVDPFGYNDVEMNLLLPFLAKSKKHELFITFMVEHINRFVSDPPKHPTLDKIFGTSAWRDVINLDDGRERKLVMLYAKELQKQAARRTGGDIWVHPVQVILEKGKSPFYLIHVSQNPKARHVMEGAVRKAGPTILRPPESNLSLFDIKQRLLSAAQQRQGATVLQIAGDAWLEDSRISWEDGVRVALKALYESDVVVIERNGTAMRKTNKPSEKDIVRPTGKSLIGQDDMFG